MKRVTKLDHTLRWLCLEAEGLAHVREAESTEPKTLRPATGPTRQGLERLQDLLDRAEDDGGGSSSPFRPRGDHGYTVFPDGG